jgi:hypothetical protein
VTQLAVVSGQLGPSPTNMQLEGWYYDDFSNQVAEECRDGRPQRIAFSPQAKPPAGVRVLLDCAPEATANE